MTRRQPDSGARPRVDVVTPELHRLGGTERWLVEQLERLTDRFSLRVYTSSVVGVDLSDVEMRHVPAARGPHLARFAWWFAANALERRRDRPSGRPDVIVSPGINGVDADVIPVHIVFSKYWERVRGKLREDRRDPRRVVRAIHRTLYVNLLRVLERHVYRGPALLAAMSTEDAREIEHRFERPPGSVSVISYGVDAATFHPARRAAARATARRRLGVAGDDVLLLLVGNDLNKKGADIAMAALVDLPQRVHLGIAGRVPEREVRAAASVAGVGDRVLAIAHTDTPLELYAAADVLVAPSREDSFHLPTLEAMAAGLPVIVSGRAGASELLVAGRDAIVLEDPTDVAALVAAVQRLVDDDDLRVSLAEHGRVLAERCTWDANAAHTTALIERELATPRVIVLAPDPGGTGGIQRATRDLLRAFGDLYGPDRVGTIAVRARMDAPIPGRVLRAGRQTTGIDAPTGMLERLRYVLDALVTARRWRRRLVVVAAHPGLAPVARASRVVSGAPYAVWCHGIEVWGRLRPSVASALRAADLVFAPSNFTARRVEAVARLPAGSVRVVPHCVPPELATDRVDGSGQTVPTVVTVARLMPANRYKGVDTLLYAWPRVRERVDATLLVVGDGPDLDRLRRIAATFDLDGSVRFLARVSDQELRDVYARSAVFAMPTRHQLEPRPEGEGFGLVYAEAGAAGLPVVAGSGGGVDDVVRDGVNGLVVDGRDHAAVADAVVRLLSDPELARRLGEAGRELALGPFSYAAFRDHVGALIRELAPTGLR
jgi:phosphatidyl-myo-inositol dimannoside synthase